MSRVGSKHTAPELAVRRALHHHGFRFRLHRRDLPGSPDICLPKYRFAVLVHGCFWHGHMCRRATLPKVRTHYWEKKIERNRRRDAQSQRRLEERGWRVRVIWTCELPEATTALVGELSHLRGRADGAPAPTQGTAP